MSLNKDDGNNVEGHHCFLVIPEGVANFDQIQNNKLDLNNTARNTVMWIFLGEVNITENIIPMKKIALPTGLYLIMPATIHSTSHLFNPWVERGNCKVSCQQDSNPQPLDHEPCSLSTDEPHAPKAGAPRNMLANCCYCFWFTSDTSGSAINQDAGFLWKNGFRLRQIILSQVSDATLTSIFGRII